MFYPTYKCKNCGTVETDYEDGRIYLYNLLMRININTNKIHTCSENGQCKILGIMEHIGFYQKD